MTRIDFGQGREQSGISVIGRGWMDLEMGLDVARRREHAMRLLVSMPEDKLSVAVGLLESLLDPVSLATAHAPYDDEPVTDEDLREISAALTDAERGKIFALQQVLDELGLTSADYGKMGQTPLDIEHPVR